MSSTARKPEAKEIKMGGIYGDMLLAWPEQMQTFNIFDMAAQINGGWTASELSEAITGIMQNTRGTSVKDSNGNLVHSGGMELWTATGGLEGKFVMIDEDVYRLTDGNRWIREGGFYRYGLEMMVGNNATESDDAAWNTGGDSFC